MDKLDLIDRKIMYELDLNTRISASKLAKKLKKSKETINFRINRLIEKKIIKGFYTVCNTSKLGWYYYKIYLKLKNITPKKEKEMLSYLSTQDHLAYLSSIEGYYDCIFLVMIRNSNDMIRFIYPFITLYGKYIQEKEILTILTVHRFNQRFLYAGDKKDDLCYPIKIEKYLLDKIENKILSVITSNARTPLIRIAKKIGVDSKIIKYRIKKLEKENIILNYVVSPDFDKLGLQHIQINISLNNPSMKKSIIEFFSSTNKCIFAVELLGKYDLSIELVVENNDEIKEVINEFRTQFVNEFNDYDISTINKEHLIVWMPYT